MKKNITELLSEKLFDDLNQSNNSKRRGNLQHIKIVCNQMEKDGVSITLNSVAKRCLETYGSPAISTVTNTGSKLGEYIRLRKDEQNIENTNIIQKIGVSARVQDPVLAQEVKILEESVKALRNENNALRVTFKKLDVDIDGGIRHLLSGNQDTKENNDKLLSAPKHSSILKSAITSIFTHLADRGYGFYKKRYGINKKILLTTAELDALKEVIDMSESEFDARFSRDK